MKKAILTIALAASLSTPAFAKDKDRDFDLTDLEEVFDSHGACQSQLVQIRNSVRKGLTVNLPGSLTSAVCKVVTGGTNDGKFIIDIPFL